MLYDGAGRLLTEGLDGEQRAFEVEQVVERQLLSTALLKTELAGRGVGLDVVRANLNALNGEIESRALLVRARNSF